MNANDLTRKVKELKELKLMLSELEQEITSIEDEIKAEMTLRNEDELVLDMFKVSWKEVVSSRFDSKAFKATHSDLYSQYSKQVVTKRFCVA